MTNDRAGTVGVGLTTGFLEPAHGVVAHQIGAQLPAHTPAALSPRTIRALLSDPVDVTAPPYRPLPPHSALALSAFCIAMLALTCGFLVDAIVQSGVDSAIETFMNTEPHFSTRGLADHLCNEATFVEWEQDTSELPDWQTSWRRLVAGGRSATLTHASDANETRAFPAPVEPPPSMA